MKSTPDRILRLEIARVADERGSSDRPSLGGYSLGYRKRGFAQVFSFVVLRCELGVLKRQSTMLCETPGSFVRYAAHLLHPRDRQAIGHLCSDLLFSESISGGAHF